MNIANKEQEQNEQFNYYLIGYDSNHYFSGIIVNAAK
jgi:hypothetical protein